MLHCEEALELISARIDGPLSGEESARLEDHLSVCPACRTLAADLEQLHAELPLLAAQPPADLTANVMNRIREQKITPFQSKKRRWQWRSLASLAAVAVLVVIGSTALGQWRQGKYTDSVAQPGANIQTQTAAPQQTQATQPETAAERAAPHIADSGDLTAPAVGQEEAAQAQPPATPYPKSESAAAGADRSATPDLYLVAPDSTAEPAPQSTSPVHAPIQGIAPASVGLTRQDALYKLGSWLGWDMQTVEPAEDGTITGPTAADGTTSTLRCVGLNAEGTGWLCQLEQLTSGPDGTASCTIYTVPLDGGDILS